MRYSNVPLMLFLLAGLSACSSYSVTQLADGEARGEGVVFYPPLPFLAVSCASGEHGAAYSSSVVYLPDRDAPHIIRWEGRGGSLNMNFTLSDGWNLTAFNSTSDSQIDELIAAVSGPLNALTGGEQIAGSCDPSAVGLYPIQQGSMGYQLGPRLGAP